MEAASIDSHTLEEHAMRPIVAKDLMSSEVLTVPEDLSIDQLSSFFIDNEITGAPVVSDDGAVIGVVSVVDVARLSSEPTEEVWETLTPTYYDRAEDPQIGRDGMHIFHVADDSRRVRDIMNAQLHSVGENATVPEIASAMLHNHIHRLLVIEDGELVGMISTSDLLGLLVDES
jgi:CBS domain-containing protein